MPVCGCCGEEVEAVYSCKRCRTYFCLECGSVDNKLCIDCQEELKEEA